MNNKNDKSIMVQLKYETMNLAKLHRKEAIALLNKIKETRKGKLFKLVRIDRRTWKEIEVKP